MASPYRAFFVENQFKLPIYEEQTTIDVSLGVRDRFVDPVERTAPASDAGCREQALVGGLEDDRAGDRLHLFHQ